jgi:hypothetical protein
VPVGALVLSAPLERKVLSVPEVWQVVRSGQFSISKPSQTLLLGSGPLARQHQRLDGNNRGPSLRVEDRSPESRLARRRTILPVKWKNGALIPDCGRPAR